VSRDSAWFFAGQLGGSPSLVRYDGGGCAAHATPDWITGAWGRSADDVWFVGRTTGSSPERSVRLHFDGRSLVRDVAPAPGNGLLSIAGRAGSDAWVTGGGGALLHFAAE
jgi:hypothetical protein